MADESQSHKRKLDDIPLMANGFSSASPDATAKVGSAPLASHNSVLPLPDDIQIAMQRAQEISASLFSDTEAKRPRIDNAPFADDKPFSSAPSAGDYRSLELQSQVSGIGVASYPSHGFDSTVKKVEIPNERGGETIKYLQLQSGAKIQVTRDLDADPNSQTRPVELTGIVEQISKVEQLTTDVLAQAEAGGSGQPAPRVYSSSQPGEIRDATKVPSNKESASGKRFPKFEAYVVEEEEGSGGYGTVYRVSRKDDGRTFAIKCPHSNANSFHVKNELKMLERFGGRSFIIRLEGSVKSGKSECFVLEHVEHDRPEVLKREIEILELQWYCYCLFKALSSLHKQGVAHRDVKPGNFLFSRSSKKGYLIDFNLALDLHNKHRLNNVQVGPPENKIALPTRSRKVLNSRQPEAMGIERTKELRQPTLPNKNNGKEKGRLHAFPDLSARQQNNNKNQQVAADGSGVTSVKDATSTRTKSAERMREPLPNCRRKELLNLAQEIIQSPRQKSLPPVTQRKRIPAPLGKMEMLLALLTPMPLQSNGSVVSVCGQLNSKGTAREKTEGPCVGTKGFRAPEVLFRSRYQGCKMDMWSAGVTILYMILGRTPFSGDPEQNIKEIAKLKGNEDLWEVAKIHDRESSFPTDLLDIRSLHSVKLKDWCKINTKKPEYIDKMPDALFDLVDRCLTVNPRPRISSEEALMHEFLSPCREELRKHRMVRLPHDPDMELPTKLQCLQKSQAA